MNSHHKYVNTPSMHTCKDIYAHIHTHTVTIANHSYTSIQSYILTYTHMHTHIHTSQRRLFERRKLVLDVKNNTVLLKRGRERERRLIHKAFRGPGRQSCSV